MRSKKFWLDVVERAVKTFGQTAGAIVSVSVASGLGFEAVNWAVTLSVAGLAAVYSVLTSIGSTVVGDPNSPSMLNE